MPRQFLRHYRRQPSEPSSPAPAQAAPVRGQPQFQTPPTRDLPPAAAPVRHSPASAQAALLSLFGRGVLNRPRPQMMDEDDPEEDEIEGASTEPVGDVDAGEDEEDVDEEDRRGDDEEGLVGEEEDDVDVDQEEEDEDEMMRDEERSPTPLPPNLRDISNLASWTVSTHKPGFGVSALRSPSPTQYWQSDGPQPHTLTLHFFKLVAVVKIRVFLDFDSDESYTPTRMVFLAGMGGNDLVEFATWEGETPCGWVDVPLGGVGGRDGGWVRRRRRPRKSGLLPPSSSAAAAAAASSPGKKMKKKKGKRKVNGKRQSASMAEYIFSESDGSEQFDMDTFDPDDNPPSSDSEWDYDDPYEGSVLKAMVIQMRVIENHQNGKDTHVRGFQVFARDHDRRRGGTAPSASADSRRRHSARKSLRGGLKDENVDGDGGRMTGLDEPDWMGEPVIR